MPFIPTVRVTATGVILPPKPNKYYIIKDYWLQIIVVGAWTAGLYFGSAFDESEEYKNGLIAGLITSGTATFRDQRFGVYGQYYNSAHFTGKVNEGVGLYVSVSASLGGVSYLRYQEIYA